jgi:hypothetical protein
MGNPEPIFAARRVQLTAPPRILKDKHVKLKLRAGSFRGDTAPSVGTLLATSPPADSEELSAAAVLATPRCHPDGAAIRRSDKAAAIAEGYRSGAAPRTENLRSRITFDALGWHMAERLQQTPLLAGDSVDVAFTIGNNDHPEYGGLELSLRDFQRPTREP